MTLFPAGKLVGAVISKQVLRLNFNTKSEKRENLINMTVSPIKKQNKTQKNEEDRDKHSFIGSSKNNTNNSLLIPNHY